MKNLKSYKGDCFSFHKDVLKSKNKRKNDPDYKNRVELLNAEIEQQFEIYKEKFDKNTLESLYAIEYNDSNKVDLQGLYDYNCKQLQKLKIELTTDDNNRVNNTCQNCSLGEINSFDHYLPQSEFSEYVVNPLNLIPSCTKCNGNKSSIWRQSGKRTFLNLYIDKLTEVQYLFVDIKIVENIIELKYLLDSKNGINNEIYELLDYHYTKLKLFDRFKDNSDTIISELDTEIGKYSKKLSLEKIIETIIEECNENFKIHGRNNWKLVLKMALVNHSEYLSRF